MPTQNEARRRWCPFARVQPFNGQLLHHGAAHDRGSLSDANGDRTLDDYCVASNCMAWRWEDYSPANPEHIGAAKGYCGLAGKP